MSEGFDRDLCDERHSTVNRRLGNQEETMNDLIKAINGKFTKVFFMFIGVLFSVIGSLVIMIVSGK